MKWIDKDAERLDALAQLLKHPSDTRYKITQPAKENVDVILRDYARAYVAHRIQQFEAEYHK